MRRRIRILLLSTAAALLLLVAAFILFAEVPDTPTYPDAMNELPTPAPPNWPY